MYLIFGSMNSNFFPQYLAWSTFHIMKIMSNVQEPSVTTHLNDLHCLLNPMAGSPTAKLLSFGYF